MRPVNALDGVCTGDIVDMGRLRRLRPAHVRPRGRRSRFAFRRHRHNRRRWRDGYSRLVPHEGWRRNIDGQGNTGKDGRVHGNLWRRDRMRRNIGRWKVRGGFGRWWDGVCFNQRGRRKNARSHRDIGWEMVRGRRRGKGRSRLTWSARVRGSGRRLGWWDLRRWGREYCRRRRRALSRRRRRRRRMRLLRKKADTGRTIRRRRVRVELSDVADRDGLGWRPRSANFLFPRLSRKHANLPTSRTTILLHHFQPLAPRRLCPS